MTFEGQCTRIGSLQVPTQESTKQISSRAIKDPKDTRKTKESQIKLNSWQSNKAIQSKSQSEYDQYIYHKL